MKSEAGGRQKKSQRQFQMCKGRRQKIVIIIIAFMMEEEGDLISSPERFSPQQQPARPQQSEKPSAMQEKGSCKEGRPYILHSPFEISTPKDMQALMKYTWLLRKRIPSMPLTHIIEVLYSAHHESLIVVDSGQVLAGMTFRQLQGKAVMELCLMASSKVRQGLGSQLVNYLKRLAQLRMVQVIATHADNSAIGFYEKLGFSQEEFVEANLLGNRHFSKSTLMQTRIHSNVDYSSLRHRLKRQTQYISHQYKAQRIHACYGLPPSDGQLHPTTNLHNNSAQLEYFKHSPSNLVGITHFWEEYGQLIKTKQQKDYRKYLYHLNKLASIGEGDSFGKVKELIDFKAIREKVINSEYVAPLQMLNDIWEKLNNKRILHEDNQAVLEKIDRMQLEIRKAAKL